MNPEIKQQWVQALRSGEYKQGRGALNRDGNFCCLGVLTDLAVKAGVCEWTLHPDGEHLGVAASGDVEIENLRPEIAKWSGLTLGAQYQLVDMNDDYELSFSTIAAYIEENL